MVARVSDKGQQFTLLYPVTGLDLQSAVVHVDRNPVARVLNHDRVSTPRSKSSKDDRSRANGFHGAVFWRNQVYAPMADLRIPRR